MPQLKQVNNNLNWGASAPILGTIPAAFKVVVGAVVAVVSLIFMVIALFGSMCSKEARESFEDGGNHCAYGLTMIIGGAFRAIPLVGTAMHHCDPKDPPPPPPPGPAPAGYGQAVVYAPPAPQAEPDCCGFLCDLIKARFT